MLVTGKLAQVGQILAGHRQGARGQIFQKLNHFVSGAGHLGGKRQLGKIGEAQQLRFLMPQRKDFFHQFGIVPLPGIWP